MKIAMVSPYDFTWPGGVNAHVAQLSAELGERGHCVQVIAPQTPQRPLATDVHGGRFISMGRTVRLSAGGSTARVSMSPWIYPRVRNLMARESFDVVHIHEPLAPLLPWMVLQHSRSVNIGTFHAFSERHRLYRFWRPSLGRWQQRLHGRIAVSPAARSFVAPHFPGHNYRIIPNGIDYDHFARGEAFPHLRDGRFNVLFVGRKDERKGLRYLVDAFARLRAERDDLRLIIVGPGGLDRESQRTVATLTRMDAESVMDAGTVSYQDLPRYYASADVFCSPATGGESFGIVLLEAMAAGAPVVASDIDGYRDVVAHEQQGLLTTPRDPAAVARAIRRIADSPDLAGRLSAAGRETAADYRWQLIASDVEEYYYQCIEEASIRGIAR